MVGEIVMIWIAIIIGIVSLVGLGYSVVRIDDISVIIILFSTLGLFVSLLLIFQTLSIEPVSYEYATDEYILEYKITTIGEKSDTVYVLTKIKEE